MDHSETKADDKELNNVCHEPLGYQNFLCDVNIEYSLGGSRGDSAGVNRQCFKLKYIPYMIRIDDTQPRSLGGNSVTSSDSSICDSQSIQASSPVPTQDERHIDVTEATCAFLGNSDFVPNHKFKHRRVVLELISAKLSQSTTYNPSPSHTSLIALAEHPRSNDVDNINNCTSNIHISPTDLVESTPKNKNHSGNNFTSSTSSLISSKRFVNYTLIIKTTPGLDNYPAVIERRFSDFLLLYQGLKSHEAYAKFVDKHIIFPKKVYMGNFSLTNIAERSILFSRLLDVCMTKADLLWSIPFVSFLLDKELKEAHRLTLCGDPDDVQALLETAYYIEQKLYLNKFKTRIDSSSSSFSGDTSANPSDQNLQTLPVCKAAYLDSSEISMISQENGLSDRGESINITGSINSSGDASEEFCYSSKNRLSSTALNQRILVTFCMLLLTYYRGESYRELKLAVREFSQLISSQDYVNSMNQTRHHMTLRACLLFLMNMNKGDVIDENQRMWLKQRLEDIDGTHINSNRSRDGCNLDTTEDSNGLNEASSSKNRQSGSYTNINGNTSVYRITKEDLTSLLRDRNFCSFQDGKFTR